MPQIIKTREVRRDIKLLDRAGTAAEKIKNTAVHIKEQVSSENRESPEESNANHLQHTIQSGGTNAVQQTWRVIRRGHRNLRRKQKLRLLRNEHESVRTVHSTAYPARPSPAQQRMNHSSLRAARPAPTRQANPSIKMVRHTEKQTIQSARKTIKTVNRTAEISAKTARRTVKTAQRSAKAAAKTAKHSARIARETAKATVRTAKLAAKAVAATIKSIIAATKALISAIAAGGWVAVLIILIICLVGLITGSAFGIFMGNDVDSEDGITVRQAVSLVSSEYYQKIQDITDGVQDLENAKITVNGSERYSIRDIWKDILAVYAARQHTRDVVLFDEQKVKVLSGVFWDMVSITHRTVEVQYQEEVIDPDTGEVVLEMRVKRNLYITVTSANPAEMTTMYLLNVEQQEILSDLLSEEFSEAWRELLFGASGGNLAIVEVAASQIGNVGGRPYWSWYGFNFHMEWCAVFVSWCANECGFIDAGIIPKFSSCTSQGRTWFQARGLWKEPGYVPSPGEIIFFDWDNSGNCDHVGIVEKVEGNIIHTIEGNSGDRVRRKTYAVNSRVIAGFGTLGI